MRSLRRQVLLLSLGLLTACASPVRPSKTSEALALASWTGRIALKVEDQPSQSFSASFALKGSAQRGDLSLISPFGNVLALLSWSPEGASLRTDGAPQLYASLEELLSRMSGSAIPVAALFDWLDGKPSAVPGWTVDLSQREAGRLIARRLDPSTELRLILEQP